MCVLMMNVPVVPSSCLFGGLRLSACCGNFFSVHKWVRSVRVLGCVVVLGVVLCCV